MAVDFGRTLKKVVHVNNRFSFLHKRPPLGIFVENQNADPPKLPQHVTRKRTGSH